MRKFTTRWSAFAGMAALAAATVAFTATPALASTNGFTNGNFETVTGTFSDGFETLTAGNASAGDLAGWTVTSGSVDVINGYWTQPPVIPGTTYSTTYSVDMNGTNSTPAAGTISQTFATDVNANYAVQFLLSANPMCGSQTMNLTVSASGSGNTPETVSASVTQAGSLGSMVWNTWGYTFVAPGDTTTLTFAADLQNTSNCGPALADVTVTELASATGAQCKDGGWQSMVDPSNGYLPFKNQGDCVSYYAVSGATPIGS